MVGDYNRYIAEYASGEILEQAKHNAEKNYNEAEKLMEETSPCDPIRLGLALSHSVYSYEVLKDKKKAIE